MVEAVRQIADPVERVLQADRLKVANELQRKQIARLRRDAQRALKGYRDAEHPKGWTLDDIGKLTGRHRNTVQHVIEGRDLGRDEPATSSRGDDCNAPGETPLD